MLAAKACLLIRSETARQSNSPPRGSSDAIGCPSQTLTKSKYRSSESAHDTFQRTLATSRLPFCKKVLWYRTSTCCIIKGPRREGPLDVVELIFDVCWFEVHSSLQGAFEQRRLVLDRLWGRTHSNGGVCLVLPGSKTGVFRGNILIVLLGVRNAIGIINPSYPNLSLVFRWCQKGAISLEHVVV
jgi:hypothetical protein